MAQAVCVSCGRAKLHAFERCAFCGFDPNQDQKALLGSVYLSVERFQDEEERRVWADQLDRLGVAIQEKLGREPGRQNALDMRQIIEAPRTSSPQKVYVYHVYLNGLSDPKSERRSGMPLASLLWIPTLIILSFLIMRFFDIFELLK